MTVKTSHEAGTAGSRKGILYICLVEPDSFIGQAVHVGSRCLAAQWMAIGADGLVGMVIRHDVNDVQSLWSFFLLGCNSRGKSRQCGEKQAVGNGIREMFHGIEIVV